MRMHEELVQIDVDDGGNPIWGHVEVEDEYDWMDRQDQGEREHTDRMAEWDIQDRENEEDK